MKRFFPLIFILLSLLGAGPVRSLAQASSSPPPNAAAPAPATTTTTAETSQADKTKEAALVRSAAPREPRPPGFLEYLVDEILGLFNVTKSENTTTRWVIFAVIIVAAFILRRVVTGFIFGQLKKLAAKTRTTLDDKLFPALEAPCATFILVVGIFAALEVLKLPAEADHAISYGSTVAFSLVIFWALLRAFNAVLDHAQEIAARRQMSIAAFMPWIKKTVVSIFVVLGVLLTVQSLGYDVKALLAGLGIGGLAFALAAQDTLANVFGSIVVAIDQPFKLGEAVKIGANEGNVEDIGLRSTKLRTPGKNLIIIPNKTVAAEAIINNSRFARRRVEQILTLTYDTKPEQMEAIVLELRGLLTAQAEIDKNSVMVFFRDLNPSSLDIWVVYETPDPDFQKHMRVRERMNLAMMRAVAARGLAFAFPTQTLHLERPEPTKLPENSQPG